MGDKTISFEMTEDGEDVQVRLSRKGVEELIAVLSAGAQQAAEYASGIADAHLMTPKWGGADLVGEVIGGQGNQVANHVKIFFVDDEYLVDE